MTLIKMRTGQFILMMLLLFNICPARAGGPWIMHKKAGYAELQGVIPWGAYDVLFFDGDQRLPVDREVLDISMKALLEYGLSDKLNLVAAVPWKMVSTGSLVPGQTAVLPEGRLNGFGNTRLGIKFRVSDGGLKSALALYSDLSTARFDTDKGLATGYPSNSIGVYGSAGKAFNKLYAYLEGGYMLRSNHFSDYLELHLETGYKLTPSFTTMLVGEWKKSIRNGSYYNAGLRRTGLYTNDQEYLAYALKFAYELKNKLGFSAAVFGAFTGNYVAYLGTSGVGIYKKW